MSYSNRPPPVNGNINTWGERLNDWLVRNRSKLAYYLTGQPATEDGILLWDAANSKVLVSSNGSWVDVGAGGGGSITNYLRDDADDTTSFRLTMGGLTVDTNTLYVDSVNNEVGIGTTNPSEKLEVVGNVEATEFIGDLRGAVVFKAEAGEALAIGDVVYISGISGNTTVVNKADADDAAKMPAFGLAANTVSNNSNVEIYTFGTLAGLDTSSYTEGDELFVGTTAGALVSTAPTGEGSLVQKVGKVTRSHGSAGSIKIMGAGRTNATPNLDSGNFFLGDSNNQAVTTSFTTAVAAAETSHSNVLVDGDFVSEGLMKRDATSGSYSIVTDNSSNWNTAYEWDDHADAGYLTSFDITTQTDPKYLRADADDTTTGTITAPNVDISTTGSVTTNIATGTGVSGNTKTVNIATGYSTGGTTTVNIAPTSSTTTKQINLNGNVSVDGTVDGRDVAADGTKLDGIATNATKNPYHRIRYDKLRHTSLELYLTTTHQNISQASNIVSPATPVKCARYIDIQTEVEWRYVSSATNDLAFRLEYFVPTSNATVTNLGTATAGTFTGFSRDTYEAWFYVSGDYTHLLTEFGRMNKTGVSGATEMQARAWYYDTYFDRTYILTDSNPGISVSSGDTIYWHPYAWESAGTLLYVEDQIDERYVSIGRQNITLRYKTAYDDSRINYRAFMREMSSADSAIIYRVKATLTEIEEV